MVNLYDAHYMMDLGCGGDHWRLTGKVWGHPNFSDGYQLFTSTPMEYNEETRILKTASGRTYIIMSFYGDEKKVVNEIKEDILRGGTLVK